MDFPKSVPGVGLVDGQFVDEDPAIGQVGSLIPAKWGNDVTRELLNVIEAAGLTPREASNAQLLEAFGRLSAGSVTSIAEDAALTADVRGLVIVDASASERIITLPSAGSTRGVVDLVIRRADNSGNRLKVQADGADKIKFHTHLNTAGYPFLVLMGAGDWWHLRSDGQGGWWPIGRMDGTTLGRPVFETTTLFSPGGWGAFSGAELVRADWPWLWDHAQQSGMLTTEAGRVGMEGGWTSGDGALTFRGPEGRAEFLRVLDGGRGTDVGRVPGSSQHGSYLPGDDGMNNDIVYVRNAYQQKAELGWDPVPPTGIQALIHYSSLNSSAQLLLSYTPSHGGTARPRNIAYPGRIKLI